MDNHDKDFRLDRSAFRIQSFEDASRQRAYWLQRTPLERLAAAWYLTCAAYNLPYRADHRLDRQAFSMRKHAL